MENTKEELTQKEPRFKELKFLPSANGKFGAIFGNNHIVTWVGSFERLRRFLHEGSMYNYLFGKDLIDSFEQEVREAAPCMAWSENQIDVQTFYAVKARNDEVAVQRCKNIFATPEAQLQRETEGSKRLNAEMNCK